MGGWEVSRNVDSVDACPKREEDGLTSFSIPVRNDLDRVLLLLCSLRPSALFFVSTDRQGPFHGVPVRCRLARGRYELP